MLHQEGDLLVCPYNTSHLIRAKRMITHLTKCRKNHIALGYKICPMDATHHIKPELFEEHLEKCPKRKVVDVACLNQDTNPPANPILSAEKIKELLAPTDEDWNDEESVPTYDPQAVAVTKNVMRVLKNAPPAERRAFQQAERLRLLELQEREAAEAPMSGVGRTNDDNTVRMPNQRSQAFGYARPNQRSNH